MATRRRQGGSGKSGSLPLPSGGSKSDKKHGSSMFGIVVALLLVSAIGAGIFLFRNEILLAVNDPQYQEHSEPAAQSEEAYAEKNDLDERIEPVGAQEQIPEPDVASNAADRNQQEEREERAVLDQSDAGTVVQDTAADTPSQENNDRLFTVQELKQYDGSDSSKPIYLALVGQVFDVTKGKQYYGKDGGYGFFSGRDGTRAFVSGDFTEVGLTDNVTGLDNANIIGIEDWLSFYHKDYTYAGKLVGTYYDEHGQPTARLEEYNQMLEVAQGASLQAEEFRRLFPPCNSHWAQGKGGTVWCSKESGGIKRDWVGVPRKFYKAGGTNYQCVCVRTTGSPSLGEDDQRNIGDLGNPNMRAYDYCHPDSATCAIKD
ncbi:neuferricin-like [Sycon ciliatum]|uniref:neuferricin-like n=1 Tax=Sycon ciliatum TaxID=27933 RepID=UPI0031F616EF